MKQAKNFLRFTCFGLFIFVSIIIGCPASAQMHPPEGQCMFKMNDQTFSKDKITCEMCLYVLNRQTNTSLHGNDYPKEKITTKKDKGALDCEGPPFAIEYVQDMAIALRDHEIAPEGSKVNYEFEAILWKMAGADDMSTPKSEAIKKVQCMWSKHREKFRCYGWLSPSVKDCNFIKFACDHMQHSFVRTMVEKYGLDLNFIDPADGRTIMDFIVWRTETIKFIKPVDEVNLQEFQKLYDFLKERGVKTAAEIKLLTKN